MNSSTEWVVLPDAESVADEAVRRIGSLAEQAIAERGCFKIVLICADTDFLSNIFYSHAQVEGNRLHLHFSCFNL